MPLTIFLIKIHKYPNRKDCKNFPIYKFCTLIIKKMKNKKNEPDNFDLSNFLKQNLAIIIFNIYLNFTFPA